MVIQKRVRFLMLLSTALLALAVLLSALPALG
jgi:hypothetical protein